GFEQHYDTLAGAARRIRDPGTDANYRQQIAWLDRFCEEFFRRQSRPANCFGNDGQTLAQSLEALRAQLLRDLAHLFDAPLRTGPVELRGLSAYRPEDADLLFGRDRIIERILEQLDALQSAKLAPPIVALAGRNGEGKSSVLRAGLVGRIRRGMYPRFGG